VEILSGFQLITQVPGSGPPVSATDGLDSREGREMKNIVFKINPLVSVYDFVALIKSTQLADRRPVDDIQRMEDMLKNSNLIITATLEGKLVGIARVLTDMSWVAYISDLIVTPELQKQGVGKRLLKEVRGSVNECCKLLLLAAPSARGYYPHIGFREEKRGWVLPPDKEILE